MTHKNATVPVKHNKTQRNVDYNHTQPQQSLNCMNKFVKYAFCNNTINPNTVNICEMLQHLSLKKDVHKITFVQPIAHL